MIVRLFLCIVNYSILVFEMTNCNLHKGQLLDHYCETCQDAICLSCRTEGPHSNSLHRTLPLVESAQMRIGHFMEYIIKTVHPLLLKAAQRVIDLSNTQKKLDDARKVIAKDIALEYESI